MSHSTPFNWLVSLKQIIGEERASGLLLVVSALAALTWANSTFSELYVAMKETPLYMGLGDWRIEKTLHHWVNDGLMALFFLLIGLEIKHEFSEGMLASRRKAALTIAAALGGMVLPALVYLSINVGGEGLRGWGVPLATDIAFAIGLLGLLGERVPGAIKIFLVAMAVVDDLGAILVIAIFYAGTIEPAALVYSFVVLTLAILYGRRNGQSLIIYLLLGAITWYFMLESGIHATLAGVLLALTIPNQGELTKRSLYQRVADWLEDHSPRSTAVDEPSAELRETTDKAQSPTRRLEDAVRPWVLLFIMPVFALFNAGVVIGGDLALTSSVTLGAALGLLIGKPVGVLAATWVATQFGARMPEGIGWFGITGIAVLAAVGFTMSLFIAQLAFGERDALLDQAKIGVLIASTLAAMAGLAILRVTLSRRDSSE
jgi:NhaA family Na+:H+ antiporter